MGDNQCSAQNTIRWTKSPIFDWQSLLPFLNDVEAWPSMAGLFLRCSFLPVHIFCRHLLRYNAADSTICAELIYRLQASLDRRADGGHGWRQSVGYHRRRPSLGVQPSYKRTTRPSQFMTSPTYQIEDSQNNVSLIPMDTMIYNMIPHRLIFPYRAFPVKLACHYLCPWCVQVKYGDVSHG